MKNLRGWRMITCMVVVATVGTARPQSVASGGAATLTLQQAEDLALRNQPRIAGEELRARAVRQRVNEARSPLLPTASFSSSGALAADTGTATAAGSLTTSSVSDRFAYGGSLTQLVSDFGRTHALVKSARSQAEEQEEFLTFTRAEVRLAVRQAYYDVLGAEAVLRAAKDAQSNRQLISRQVSALAQSELRSTLDVNFAKVLESEAELAVVHAQSLVEQARAHLATEMGEDNSVTATLTEPPLPAEITGSANEMVPAATASRADLQVARSAQSAAEEFAKAERKLSYPSLNVVGAAGQLPFHDHTLHDNYAAAGFNLTVPVFNGGLFAARREEAKLDAQARAKDVDTRTLAVKEQVRDSWYQANEAFRSLDVSTRLVEQSRMALKLAQARYDNALGSIVELNEAQVNETAAEISAAGAKYTYLSRRAALDFAAGLLN